MKKNLKRVKKLKSRKHRQESDRFIVEGIRNTEEALKSSVRVESILYTKKLLSTDRGKELHAKIKKTRIELKCITDLELAKLCSAATPQGVLAVCEKLQHDLFSLMRQIKSPIVVLDGIQDPGNLGTIIRTADAAGAGAIIAGKGTVDMYNPKVLSASMGSIMHIPVVYVEDLAGALNALKLHHYRVIACDAHGSKKYTECFVNEPLAIVLGNEGSGLHKEIFAMADEVVSIPIEGRAESLNVGVTCGIILYHMISTRGGSSG
ncbi:MAG: RNA methyltransferase [bacterium]